MGRFQAFAPEQEIDRIKGGDTGERGMAENTVRKEGLDITVGLDTDGDNRIWATDFILDPPSSRIWLIIKNISNSAVPFRLPTKAKACFVIMDNEHRRIWTYPGHVAHVKTDFRLKPGEVFEKRMDAPWNDVFIKPGVDHILVGWLSRHPHLSASIRFSLALKKD